MASIRKRGDSYLITVSCGYDALGKQVRQQMTWTPPKELNSREIKRELDKQAVLFEQEVRCGRISSAIKFRDFAEQWFEEYAIVRLKRKTYERYKGMIGRVYDSIGHIKVSQMTTRQIQQFISSLSKDGANKTTGGPLSPKTVKNYLSMISTIMTYAEHNQLIMMNPCKHVVIPRQVHKEIECYTLEQAQRMLELFEQEPQEDLKFTVFFALAMYSGMRRGELLGLEWQDFDFETGRVEIVRTSLFSKSIGNYTDTPKTESSRRVLILPTEVIDMVKKLKEYQFRESMRIGSKWEEHHRLFTQWNGKPMDGTAPYKYLQRFCKKYDFPFHNIHSFRHLNATLLISCGVDPRTVSACLGHSQTSTTLNIYTHCFQEQRMKAMGAVADKIGFKRKVV
ncbi:MAG: site-specific integrase [Ruminococcus sp.]|nr:site-specific integrase [Ruminococcus sp.]